MVIAMRDNVLDALPAMSERPQVEFVDMVSIKYAHG
jgi:hypothetical protein